jgi:hypothetical protein
MDSNLKDLKKELNFIRFKKFFLLEFTRQLIKNSAPSDIFKLQTILEKEKKYKIEEAKDKIKERMKDEEDVSTKLKEIEEGKINAKPSIIHSAVGMFGTQDIPHINPFKESFKGYFKKDNFVDPFKKIGLKIPESKFPVHLQYIKPVPMNNEIELGKLNPLITDPMVRIIECYGPGENIVVQGNMGTKKTGIILDREEIDTIIQRFSRETKIPIEEGIFKVVAGKLMILAIVSGVVASKFTIKKMLQNQQQNYNNY